MSIPFADYISDLAAVIGSLTVVGSALIWVWKKVVSEPREEKKARALIKKDMEKAHEERQRYKKILKMVDEEKGPLLEAIEKLNILLEESKKDRQNLNTITKQHHDIITKNSDLIAYNDARLDTHNDRILTLEVLSGIKKSTNTKKGEDKFVE